MKATILTIGDEILIGQTIDTNSGWMAEKLKDIGIEVTEIITISDQKSQIVTTLDRIVGKTDLILTTGGLGPTEDDRTKATLATYFGTELVLNEIILERIRKMYERRGRVMTQEGAQVAYVPKDFPITINEKGTAPALWFGKDGTQLIAMPGVPYEMKHFMTTEIIPSLRKKMPTNLAFYHKTLMVAGQGETTVSATIKEVLDTLPPQISIAYLPSLGVLRLRITGKGDDPELIKTAVDMAVLKIDEKIAPWVYGYDGKLLEVALGEMLLERKATLGIAESCTGGAVAARVVSVPGSSAYFEGGVVAYSNKIKEQLLGVKSDTIEENGAVSDAVVKAMAQGMIEKFDVDYAIATSGIAGPTGGTPAKPVGTIWVAIASKTDVFTKKYQLTNHRDINIGLTVNMAMNDLRRFLVKEEKVAIASS